MISKIWRPKPLILTFGITCLLIISWFVPVTRVAWDILDLAVFSALNKSLYWHVNWQLFWALANHRLVDVFAAGTYVVLYFCVITQVRPAYRLDYLATGLLIPFYTFTILEVSSNWVFTFERPSPSLIVAEAVRLSDLVVDFDFKDASTASFPSDHGISVIFFTVFLWRFGGRRIGFIALGTAILFIAPRLMSGGHWLSDTLVGSVVVAFLSAAVLLATPIHGKLQHGLSITLRTIFSMATRLLRYH